MTPDALQAAISGVLEAAPGGALGVAVSGGSDSLAMLLLLVERMRATGGQLRAVTVDHGLRAESAAEARFVAEICAGLDIPHDILRWDGAGAGNLQARARDARRRLISAWAQEHGVASVALGHTLDDQAETFLLRLARGSGVDGLSGMQPVSCLYGLTWLRPVLGLRRETLRAELRRRDVGWNEDPSNADRRYERVRMRDALEPLAELGISPERLAGTAARMARARAALEASALDLARDCVSWHPAGEVSLLPEVLAKAPEELRLRLLGGLLCLVSGAVYRPRLKRLEALLALIIAGETGGGQTLHGCVIRALQGRVVIRREPAHAVARVAPEDGVWDGRWRILSPQAAAGLQFGATGADGLAQLPDWRQSGLAREVALTTPALWDGERLVAAPFAGRPAEAEFRPVARGAASWLLPLCR